MDMESESAMTTRSHRRVHYSVALSRRKFLNRAASIGVTAAAKDAVGSLASLVYCGNADDRINVGLIGCGARGKGATVNALNTGPDVRLTAMADIFPERLKSSLDSLRSAKNVEAQVDVPGSRQFTGFSAYTALLQSNVDVVILAAPTGFRPEHFRAAIDANKHVFMESAVAVDVPGVRQILATNEQAKRKSLQVAVGFNNRHSVTCRETLARIREGAIGRIEKMEVYWHSTGLRYQKRQANQSEMEYQLRNWPYFVWLSGDFMVQHLAGRLDVCNWAAGTHPVRAKGTGGRREFHSGDYGEVYDYFSIAYQFTDGTSLKAETSVWQSTQKKSPIGELLYGVKGVAEPSPGTITGPASWKSSGKYADSYQLQQNEFFAALRRGGTLNEVDTAATATLTAIMGRLAAYSGTEVTWDDTLNSKETLAPKPAHSLTDIPPTQPDKFGDYATPVRG